MNTANRSNVVRINAYLRKLGRKERLVRGRGYYYLMGGEAMSLPSSSIYVWSMNDMPLPTAVSMVAELFECARNEVTRGIARYLREELQ